MAVVFEHSGFHLRCSGLKLRNPLTPFAKGGLGANHGPPWTSDYIELMYDSSTDRSHALLNCD